MSVRQTMGFCHLLVVLTIFYLHLHLLPPLPPPIPPPSLFLSLFSFYLFWAHLRLFMDITIIFYLNSVWYSHRKVLSLLNVAYDPIKGVVLFSLQRWCFRFWLVKILDLYEILIDSNTITLLVQHLNSKNYLAKQQKYK